MVSARRRLGVIPGNCMCDGLHPRTTFPSPILRSARVVVVGSGKLRWTPPYRHITSAQSPPMSGMRPRLRRGVQSIPSFKVLVPRP